MGRPINFDDAKKGLDLIDEDRYTMRVVKAEIKQSKSNPENDVIHMTAEIVDGDFRGRKLMDWFALAPNTLWSTVPKVEAILGHELSGEGDWDDILIDMLGSEFEADITQELHHEPQKAANGELVNKIGEYYKDGGSAFSGI